jgi:CRP-like cAMP-binding protein
VNASGCGSEAGNRYRAVFARGSTSNSENATLNRQPCQFQSCSDCRIRTSRQWLFLEPLIGIHIHENSHPIEEEIMADKYVLSDFAFFSNLTDDQLDAIAQKCNTAAFDVGDYIFQLGEPAKNLYGILHGTVELSLIFRTETLKVDIKYEDFLYSHKEIFENPIIVDTIGTGQIFGWSSLIKPHQQTASARCVGACRVFYISANDLRAMFDKDSALGFLIMERLGEMISQRLVNRTENLIEAWGQSFAVKTI